MRKKMWIGPRCMWCGVILRWWQRSTCRVCHWYFAWDYPSPPCSQKSRWDKEPDHIGDARKDRQSGWGKSGYVS